MDARQTALAVIEKLSGVASADLTADLQLVGDLGIDSPKALELLLELEQRLNIEIGDEEVGGMATVGDILGYVERAKRP